MPCMAVSIVCCECFPPYSSKPCSCLIQGSSCVYTTRTCYRSPHTPKCLLVSLLRVTVNTVMFSRIKLDDAQWI